MSRIEFCDLWNIADIECNFSDLHLPYTRAKPHAPGDSGKAERARFRVLALAAGLASSCFVNWNAPSTRFFSFRADSLLLLQAGGLSFQANGLNVSSVYFAERYR